MFNKASSIFFSLTVVAIFAFNVGSAEADNIITDGLIHYWTFDQANVHGDTAEDIWGDNDGTLVGDPQIGEGEVKEALEFDGDDYIELDDSTFPVGNEPRTVSAWAEYVGDGSTETIFYYGVTSTCGQRFDVHQRVEGIGIAYCCHFWGSPEKISGWHHITVVILEEATSSDKVEVYIDGERTEEATLAGSIQGTWGTVLVGKAWIAGRDDAATYKGVIDDVLLYNRALSPEEVKQNYTARGFAVDAAGSLVTLWGRLKTR